MSEPSENKSEDNKKDESTEPQNHTPEIPVDEKWLIRECDLYKDEYKECTSIRGRFHQYFIYGDVLNCNQWKKDYDNCCKWTDKEDTKAGLAVIESEKERRMQRLRAHYRNDIWKKRDGPPPDWSAPLPDWMVKRDANTYLAARAQEMREGKPEEEPYKGYCSIM